MSASNLDVKKYVGAAGDALVYMWQRLKGQTDEEAEPPVGSQDKFGGRSTPAAVAVGGISTTTLLLIGVAWWFLRKR